MFPLFKGASVKSRRSLEALLLFFVLFAIVILAVFTVICIILVIIIVFVFGRLITELILIVFMIVVLHLQVPPFCLRAYRKQYNYLSMAFRIC